MNLWLIFLTGLSSGGISCFALQSGLLITAINSQNKNLTQMNFKHTILPTGLFLIAKIIAYTILGFLLGLFGSFFQLSPIILVIMQFVAGIFMIITALQMFDVHPFFKKFVIVPPKFIFKFMRKLSLSGNYFSPIFLGFLTVFLPCGITQAMEAQAISSSSPISGALTMFVFILGTIPFFFLLGVILTGAREKFSKYIYPIAATLILFLGILSIDNGLTLIGSSFTLKDFVNTALNTNNSSSKNSVMNNQNFQTADIKVNDFGYEPNIIKIKANIPTKLNFITNNTQSCSRAIVIPTLKISQVLPTTGTTTVNLPPLKPGKIAFSCSMGMYRGEIIIN